MNFSVKNSIHSSLLIFGGEIVKSVCFTTQMSQDQIQKAVYREGQKLKAADHCCSICEHLLSVCQSQQRWVPLNVFPDVCIEWQCCKYHKCNQALQVKTAIEFWLYRLTHSFLLANVSVALITHGGNGDKIQEHSAGFHPPTSSVAPILSCCCSTFWSKCTFLLFSCVWLAICSSRVSWRLYLSQIR